VTDSVALIRNVRIGRQSIHDAARRLVAYELMFRAFDDSPPPAGPGGGERATSQVIASTFGTFGVETIAGDRPVFVNFTRTFLTGIIPIPVEADRVVIEVMPGVAVDAELVTGLNRLRDDGYRLALSGFTGEADRSALLDLVDYVSVDAVALAPARLDSVAEQARRHDVALIARRVESEDTFEHCAQAGFALFQGELLQRPSVVERRMLSPTQLVCVRLLNELADDEAPIDRLEQMVGTDPGLALRLLRSANSASAGSTREVTSLRRALISIGPRRLRSWVVLTLLEGGTANSSSDGLWSVLARAFTCRRLTAADPDLAFTVGLLSGAAQLLGVPPETVAESAGLAPAPRAALLTGAGEAGAALTAVLAHERDDDSAVAATGLSPFDVSRAYLESLAESLKLVTDLTGR
jgi:c-di-GMP-related signal transduction protein